MLGIFNKNCKLMSGTSSLIFAELSHSHIRIWSGNPASFSSDAEHKLQYVLSETIANPLEGDALPDNIRLLKEQWATLTGKPLERIDYLCISPADIKSFETHAATEIRQDAVAAYEVDEVFRSGQNIGLPEGYVVQHTEVLGYFIDQCVKIRDPVGMSGKRLEGHFHLLAVRKKYMEHLEVIFKKNGIQVASYVLRPVLFAYESWGEKDYNGQKLMIALGRDDCYITIVEKGICRFVSHHVMGESLMDRDLATCLGISLHDAQNLRTHFPEMLENNLLRRSAQGIDTALVLQVLQARAAEMVQEIFKLVAEHIKWDLLLRIEVQSHGIDYYWYSLLQRSFPQATIHFASHTHKDDSSESWDVCRALCEYSTVVGNKKKYVATGWRYWWELCKNWVEYHL